MRKTQGQLVCCSFYSLPPPARARTKLGLTWLLGLADQAAKAEWNSVLHFTASILLYNELHRLFFYSKFTLTKEQYNEDQTLQTSRHPDISNYNHVCTDRLYNLGGPGLGSVENLWLGLLIGSFDPVRLIWSSQIFRESANSELE